MANLAILDISNVNVKTSSTSNSTTILSRLHLHLLGSRLKTAWTKLKPPKIIVPKIQQASSMSSNSKATKFTVSSCLPLHCFRFRSLKAPEPDQTVDNRSLANTPESDLHNVIQPSTSSNSSTKSTTPSCLLLPQHNLEHFQETPNTELLSKPCKSNVTKKEEELLVSKRPYVEEDLILKAGNNVLKESSNGQKYLWHIARQHYTNRKHKNTILMNIHNKYRTVRSVGEDCHDDKDLKTLIADKHDPICFKRFQPSGLMHIAEGIMEVMNVNKLTKAGCRVRILIADQLARMNKKLGGDMEKIETVGLYMIEVWKALGMSLEDGKVEILWSSKEVGSRVNDCWKFMDRTDEVMNLNASQISTLGMQCADIFFLQADICQFGMDKREVNILAREYCDKTHQKNKPIVLSHHILPGLKEGQDKMSKKIPSSAIFINDSEAEVNRKIGEAYCPEMVVEGNPCLEYIKHIIFPWFNAFVVELNEQDGGVRAFESFEYLVVHYECGILQPDDLKPVRNYFEDNDTTKQLLRSVLEGPISNPAVSCQSTMATTLPPLEPPSTTVLDNNSAHSEAKTSPKPNMLHHLVSELKKALPKHLKGKRKQASASSEGAEGKLTSSPTKTEDKKDEIIEIQSPTSLNSTKSSNPSCLPLKNFVLKRKQASPEGQGIEGILPSSPRESNQWSKTKMTIHSWFLKRKQALPLKELEEKPEEEEQKSPSSSSTSFSTTEEEEKQKSHSSSEEQQKLPSSEKVQEQQKPSSSSSTTKEQEHQKQPSSSTTEEREEGQQKPPSTTEEQKSLSSTSQEDPSNSNKMTNCLSLNNILPPKIQQAVSSKGLVEKMPASSKDAIETQPPKPSKSTQVIISSFFSIKNIVPKRKQALSSKELEEKPTSSSEEAIQTTPSSSEPAPAVDDKQKPPSEEEEQQKLPSSPTSEEQEPPSSSEEEQQKPMSSSEEEQEQQKPPSTTKEQKPPSSTSDEVPSNSTKPPSSDDKHLALQYASSDHIIMQQWFLQLKKHRRTKNLQK
ncbi:hypothetical protein ACLB2K_038740 [Fragaria x ananassa]